MCCWIKGIIAGETKPCRRKTNKVAGEGSVYLLLVLE
jgi:hypothetical protein